MGCALAFQAIESGSSPDTRSINMFTLIFKIIFVILCVYVLYKICFPEDYTEVDVILDEYKEMKKKE